jgi:hypothetical protein
MTITCDDLALLMACHTGLRECYCLWRDWARDAKKRRAIDAYEDAKQVSHPEGGARMAR